MENSLKGISKIVFVDTSNIEKNFILKSLAIENDALSIISLGAKDVTEFANENKDGNGDEGIIFWSKSSHCSVQKIRDGIAMLESFIKITILSYSDKRDFSPSHFLFNDFIITKPFIGKVLLTQLKKSIKTNKKKSQLKKLKKHLSENTDNSEEKNEILINQLKEKFEKESLFYQIVAEYYSDIGNSKASYENYKRGLQANISHTGCLLGMMNLLASQKLYEKCENLVTKLLKSSIIPEDSFTTCLKISLALEKMPLVDFCLSYFDQNLKDSKSVKKQICVAYYLILKRKHNELPKIRFRGFARELRYISENYLDYFQDISLEIHKQSMLSELKFMAGLFSQAHYNSPQYLTCKLLIYFQEKAYEDIIIKTFNELKKNATPSDGLIEALVEYYNENNREMDLMHLTDLLKNSRYI